MGGEVPEIRAIRRPLNYEHSIRTHTAVAIADPGDLLRGQMQTPAAIVDHDEIVTGAVHLAETQHAESGYHNLPAKPRSGGL